MLVNGKPAPHIPADDRGLAYGDGVFRTVRSVNGKPLHWARQYAKLAHDCGRLAIPCPAEAILLAQTLEVASGFADAVVKITVTRGVGPRGYAPPALPAPTRIVSASRFTPSFAPAWEAREHLGGTGESGITVRLCNLRLSHQPALAGIKHLNRLENVLARAEWRDPEIREGLLLDLDGSAIGGTMSNLFIVENGTLVTPDLSRCGVAGVTRERVLDIAGLLNIPCRVETLPLQRVLDASEIFFVNSLIGLWPVAALADKRWLAGAIGLKICAALAAADAQAASSAL